MRGADLVNSVLKWLYAFVPVKYRPELRRYEVRLKRLAKEAVRASGSRGRFVRGERVVWLRREVADIEPFVLAGPTSSEVLVETEATVISPGTERAFLLGLPNTSQSFPSGAGYSGVGRVIRCGGKSGDWRVGDRVAGAIPHASHAALPAGSYAAVPERVGIEEAAFAQIGAIALQGVRRASIAPGSKVAIIGVGLIGQLTLQLARWAGATPLIAMARTRRYESRAYQSGCDQFISLDATPEALDEVDADVVIEATGNPHALESAMRSTREGGSVVLLGSSRGMTGPVDFERALIARRLSVVGAHISSTAKLESSPGRWTASDEIALFLRLAENGVVTTRHIIDDFVVPESANAVYESLVEGQNEAMGLMFDWNGSSQQREDS